jgi:hypothetical protein
MTLPSISSDFSPAAENDQSSPFHLEELVSFPFCQSPVAA